MESQFTNLGMMGLSVLLDVTVTILIVRKLCKSRLICSFNPSSLILFNVLILIFCTILIRLDISMGTGVGLFAVLAMFRFRSEVLKTQEMFYLLMLIGIGFVHAAFPDVLTLTEVIFIDVALIGMSFFLTKANKPTKKFKITLNDIELIKPDNESRMNALLEKKLGFTFKNIDVVDINMKKGRVDLIVETDRPIETVETKKVAVTRPRTLEISHIQSIPMVVS